MRVRVDDTSTMLTTQDEEGLVGEPETGEDVVIA
jgi:hypothetical protein